MKLRFARIIALAGLLPLAGCPTNPAAHPSISVSIGQNVLVIKGAGFSTTENLCAHLSLQGAQTGPRSIGDPTCSGGGFSGVPYPYSYGGCTQTNSTTTVTVFAQDPSSSAGASQTIQIPWGSNCSLQAANCLNSGASCIACGGEGQPVCLNGGCVEPVAEGQPICSNTGTINAACVASVCNYQAQQQPNGCKVDYPDLHPTLAGNQLVCTANCGHTQGYSPCYPYMDGCNANPGTTYPNTILAPENACVTTQSGLSDFTCYDNAQIENNGSCLCVPSNGKCPSNSSPGDGTCRPAQQCRRRVDPDVVPSTRAEAFASILPGSSSTLTGRDPLSNSHVISRCLEMRPEKVAAGLGAQTARNRFREQSEMAATIHANSTEIFADRHSQALGNPRGKVEIVEFFDFRCPYCKSAAPLLEDLAQHDKRVRIVFKNLPVLGPDSLYAARLGLAAARQGRFADYYAAVFTRVPGHGDRVAIDDAVKSIGLNPKVLFEQSKNKDVEMALQRDRRLASTLGVTGTPALIVGDRLLVGAPDHAGLSAAIDAAIEREARRPSNQSHGAKTGF